MTDGRQGMIRQGINMQSRSFKLLQAAMLTGAANIAIVGSAHAQEQVMSFNMPDQSLSVALKDYALKTGKNLVYPPQMVANKRAKAVSGRHTPSQALRLLLKGTSISFREIQPNVLALSFASTAQFRKNATRPAAAPAVVQSASTTAVVQDNPSSDYGNTGVVSGTVVNKSTGAALGGALVSIDGTNLETVTDDRGQYYFPAVPRGQQTVRVEYLGEQVKTAIVSVSAGSRQQANVELGQANQDIVVFGFRSSIQQALNKQKTADNNASIVSSDLLGGFPAETVSEALRRVPGIAFGRNDETGEGSRITVRGFSSEAINVQLNGLDLQGTDFQRTIDLSGFLAENISEIRVQKSLLPSMESNGSGGRVEIETKSGLDYGDFSFNFGIEGESGFDRSFGEEYQVSGTLAKKITDNFGIAGTLVYRKTDRRNYDIAISDSLPIVVPAGFPSAGRVPPPAQFPYDEEFSDRLLTGATYSQRDRDEENLLASLNLAWDIGSHTKLRLDLQRNEREAATDTSRTVSRFFTSSVEMPIPELDGEVRRRTVFTGFAPFIGLKTRDQELVSNSISLRGETLLNRWTIEYKAGYNKTTSKSSNVSIGLTGNTNGDLAGILIPGTLVTNPDDDASMTPRVVDGAVTTTSNGVPIVLLNDVGQDYLFDPANYFISSANRTSTDSPTEAYFAEGSVRYDFDTSFVDYLEAGFKYDRSERNSADERFATASISTLRPDVNYSRIFPLKTSTNDIGTGFLNTASLLDIGQGGISFPAFNIGSIGSLFDGLAGLTEDDPSTAFNEERFRFTDASTLDPINDVAALRPARTIEDRIAGYIEAKLELGDFEAIGGVRWEQTYRSGRALSTPTVFLNEPGTQREPRATFIEFDLVNFVDVSGTQATWTPSILVNYRPIDNLVARFGYFRSTVNPDFRLIRRSNVISIDLRPDPPFSDNPSVIISEANPGLKPSTTDNFDFDIAYYFDDSPGLLRASFFYKKVSNNFTNVLFQGTPNDGIRERVLDELAPLVAARPDLFEFQPNTIFRLNRPENGEGGKIYGFELEAIRRLDFLPGFLSDFGVLGNLTYTKGDFPTLVQSFDADGNVGQTSLDRPLADQSAWVYNISLDYAHEGFEARLIYTRQTETVTAYRISDLNSIIPAFSTLDLRMSYTFDKLGGNWTVFLEGDDLLRSKGEADIRTATGSTPGRSDASFFFPDSLQFNGGRTVTMGLRAKF